MKYILLSLAAFIIISACSSKSDLKSDPEEITIRNLPLYNNSVFSDTAKAEADEQPAKVIQSRPKSAVKRNANIGATRRNMKPVYTSETTAEPRVVDVPVATTPVPVATQDNTASAGTGTTESTSAETIPEPEKKKGWSKAAKGTVIGAGAGAIGGAILSKKKGLGAIVGGVVGAAGGYIIGKKMDKKDNRLTTE